jgi:hypothetical protein
LKPVAGAQQRAGFVALLAKNLLSHGHGFGMMRMASKKEFKEVPRIGATKSPRGFEESLEANTRPHFNKGDSDEQKADRPGNR